MSNPKPDASNNQYRATECCPDITQFGVRALEDLPVIMVVEDDESVQSIVEEALTDGGFEPAIAASGEEAVTLLKGGSAKYRALVTDVNLLGRIGGWDVARLAREIDAN